jgi:hypothetical protein
VKLWLPFAAVGLAGGWLSDGLLANPLVDVIPRRSRLAAAIAGAVLGAVLGAALSEWSPARRPFGGGPLTKREIGALVVGWGFVAGGSVGWMEGVGWSAVSGAFFGALAFVPVCAFVHAAASRAERARHGSLVASADRRAVWSILATALSVTTLAGALEVPASSTRDAASFPRVGFGIGAAVWLIVGAVIVADAVALRGVSRLGRGALEERDPSDARDGDAVPALDLGLGDEVRARMGVASNAYRSRARPVALLLGSLAEARAALVRAILRGALGLAIASAVLAGHLWAETPAALSAYLTKRCDSSKLACYDAGLLLLHTAAPEGCPAGPAPTSADEGRFAVAPDPSTGRVLLDRACESGNRCACDALLRAWTVAYAGVKDAPRPPLPRWYTPPPRPR